MEYILELFDVKKDYIIDKETIPILKGINMNVNSPISPIRQGEFVMIRGSSGGGKSSFLNLIATLDKPTSGIVKIFGDDINKLDTSSIRLRKIGIVFQSFNLISTLTCEENIELPMLLDGKLSEEERYERTMYLLHLIKLQSKSNFYPSDLSGGEQQRIAIARSLVNDPSILYLDEPTGDLDRELTDEIMTILKTIHGFGKTIIMVTHDDHLESYADRILYFRNGLIEKVIDQNVVPPKIFYFNVDDPTNTEVDVPIEKSQDFIPEAPQVYTEVHPLYSDDEEEVYYIKSRSTLSRGNPDDMPRGDEHLDCIPTTVISTEEIT